MRPFRGKNISATEVTLSRPVPRWVIASGLGASLISLAAMGQQPPSTTSKGGPELQEIVVTGSLIKRTDTETPSPVQVISAADLQNSGYTTVSDVLRNLSANGAGTLSQSFNQAFAGGGSGIALRGLSVGATLTLIDGHRMVGYPLTDDGERNFVDVTAIPFNAVDHIEVLKDGASAAYGSDAIAGVVNIILKKSFTGAEFAAEYGQSSHHDGTMTHLTGLWGMGDLGADGHNFYVSAEYRRENQILLSDRNGQYTTLNFNPVGGLNTTPGAGSDPFGQNFSGFPGSKTGYLFNPTTPNAAGAYPNGLPGEAFLPGCNAAAQAADRCTFTTPGLQLQPPTVSANILAKFTQNLGSDWQTVTSASIFETKAQQVNPTYSYTNYPNGATIISLPPGGLPNVHIYPPITVPATYPGNPYGAPAALQYNFAELGTPYTQFKTDTYRFVQDLTGSIAGWDFGASAGYMYSILSQDGYGFIEPGAVQTALNDGYVLGSSSGASQFAPVAHVTDASYLFYGNAHGQHPLFQLPGGNLVLLLGAEWYEKKLNSPAAPSSVNGTQAFLNDAYSIGSQADTAGFAELNAPILKNLEANISVRYDHYNTAAGGATTPKFGIKYSPIEMLAVRGTYGKGFRAPSIPETNSGLAFGAGAIPDPLLCPGGNATAPGAFPSQCVVGITGVQTGNRALKPEKTTNYTFGVIFEPSKAFNASIDYYDIKVNQDIISTFEAGGLGIGGLTQLQRLGPLVTLPQVQANGTVANAVTPVPLITYNAYPYVNASQDETNGIDVDIRSRFELGAFGNLSAELTYTRTLVYKIEALGVAYEVAGTQGPSGISGDTGNPKNRGTFSLTWDRGPLSATATLNYIGGWSVTDPSAGQFTCAQAIYGNSTTEYGPKFQAGAPYPGSYCHVPVFTDVDLTGRWRLTDNLQAHIAVTNLFDRPPSFDAVTYGGGGGSAYSAGLEQTGAVGRYYTVGLNYKF
ncbi:MAG: TonB-dependent receptor [Steroidobacteraceae bacterium]